MEKNKKDKIITIVLLVVLLLYTVSIVKKTFENDVFFTITVGNKILNQGFYTEETFTIHEGLKFGNIKWLFDIIVAMIYNAFSFEGIYVFTVIAACLVAITAFCLFLKNDVNKVMAFISTIVMVYCLRGALSCRAQIVSYTIMMIEFYFINKLLDTGKYRYSLYLIGLAILMANLHGPLFPMFIVIFLPYLAEVLLTKIPLFKNGKFSKDSKIYMKTTDKKLTKVFIITFVICAFGGFYTPYAKTFLAYTDLFYTIGNSHANFISELQPISLMVNVKFTTILVISILTLIINKKVRLPYFLYLLGFGLIGILNTRNTYYFFLFGIISITLIMKDFLENYKFKENKLPNYIKNYALAIILIMLISESFMRFNFHRNDELLDREYLCAVGAADYLLENYDVNEIRLYNSFNVGAYLELRGLKVFIDSRVEIYLDNFNNTSVMRDYLAFGQSENSGAINGFFEKYDFTHLVMESDRYFQKRDIIDKNWDIVYIDESFVVCERKDFSEKAVEKIANQ